jgi:methionine aminotransferase
MVLASVKLASRLPSIGTNIFTVMSALANQHKAINLSQGFPDFESPPGLIEAVYRHMRAQQNQYPPMAGVLALREAIAAKVEMLYGTQYHADSEITVTAGATQAIFTAVAAVVGPGDEAIVFEPVYDSYIPAIELNGGRAVICRLEVPGYHINWQAVRAAITPKTRMIIINSPNNPTGSVLDQSDLDELASIVRDTDIVVLADEVYEHVVFDGRKHVSVAAHPELSTRSFVVSSFGKTYHVTGWKVAYCVAPAALTTEFRKAHQFVVFTVNSVMQHALADFMSNTSWYHELGALYQGKRDQFRALIAPTPFELLPCAGTYFQCVRYQGDEADTDFTRRLTIETGVAAIPVSAFYADRFDAHVIRFCFAKSTATLEAAALRLASLA